jgi:hypothetical protein
MLQHSFSHQAPNLVNHRAEGGYYALADKESDRSA